MPGLNKRLAAEVFGTFWLVLGGCGTAVLVPNHDGKLLMVSLAFGLTVLTMAYAVGHISGGHFNPAVTIGLAVARRFEGKDVGAYIGAQVVGGALAAAVLFAIASGADGFEAKNNFAANGFGDFSPGGYAMWAVIVTEIVMTAFFLLIILGATSKKAPAGFAPIAIGLGLTLIHLISIPVSNTSVNPARSIGPALFAGGDAISQLWVFVLAPIVGAVIAGVLHVALLSDEADAPSAQPA